VIIARFCQHSFIADYLSPQSYVVDCGSHLGEFSKHIINTWQCKVFGLEPDPRFFKRLPQLDNGKFFQLALSNREGAKKLFLGKSNCSSLYFSENGNEDSCLVETVSLPEFCTNNNIHKIDLLKMDIEGAEIDVLYQLENNFLKNKVVQLTVEFHTFLDSNASPHILRIISKLKRNNFYYVRFSRATDDVLFINQKFIPITSFDKFCIFYVKYKRGVGRIIERMKKQRY
jgi:FkbM family methyltransferase